MVIIYWNKTTISKNNINENYSPLNNPLQQPVILYIRCLSVLISHDPSRLMLILIECFHVTDIQNGIQHSCSYWI